MLESFLGRDAVMRINLQQFVQQIVGTVGIFVLRKVPVGFGMLAKTLVQTLLAVVAAVGKRGGRFFFLLLLASSQTPEAEPQAQAQLSQIQRLLPLGRLDVAPQEVGSLFDALVAENAYNFGQRVEIVRILEERIAPRQDAQEHYTGSPNIHNGGLVRIFQQNLRWTISGSSGARCLHLLLHHTDVANLTFTETFAHGILFGGRTGR